MTTTTMSTTVDTREAVTGSLFGRFLKRPLGVTSLAVIVLIILVAVFANLLAPFDPNHVDLDLV